MKTHYTKSGDGVSIAYQVYGQDEPVMICVPGALSNLMLADVTPPLARIWEQTGRFCRVVRFDKRGTGLSDRTAASAASIAQQVPDVEAVRKAVGVERVVLNGLSQGAAVAVRHTAERRFAAVLFTDIVHSTAEQRARGDRAWPRSHRGVRATV